jgi:putative ABC transport system permease protein
MLTVVVTIFFGLAPAFQASRVDIQRSLHEAGARTSAGRAKHSGLKMLVAGEIAFAVVLLVAAGLTLRVWQKMLTADPGFRAEDLFTFNLKLPPSGFINQDEVGRFFEQVIDNIRTITGVTAASGTNALPMRGVNKFPFEAEGVAPHDADPPILMRWIFPDYFKTMGIPLMAGRDFNAYDGRTEQSNVAIVDQSFARRYWPGANPVGKRIRIREEKDWQGQWRKSVGLDQWMTVLGVAHDVANIGLDRAIEPGVYIPYRDTPPSRFFLMKTTITILTDPKTTLLPQSVNALPGDFLTAASRERDSSRGISRCLSIGASVPSGSAGSSVCWPKSPVRNVNWMKRRSS